MCKEECTCEENIIEQSGEQENYIDESVLIELEATKEYNRMDLESNYELDEEYQDYEEIEQAIVEGKSLGVFYQMLIQSGLSNLQAFELTMNRSTALSNIEMSKLDIEKVKLASVNADKERI